jgi:hypothetical protein
MAEATRLPRYSLEGRPCRVFTSDVRVRVQATGLSVDAVFRNPLPD